MDNTASPTENLQDTRLVFRRVFLSQAVSHIEAVRASFVPEFILNAIAIGEDVCSRAVGNLLDAPSPTSAIPLQAAVELVQSIRAFCPSVVVPEPACMADKIIGEIVSGLSLSVTASESDEPGASEVYGEYRPFEEAGKEVRV